MLELRELRRSDIPEINKWRSERSLVASLGAPYRFIGPEIDERWFDNYLNSRSNTIRCAIVEQDDPDTILGLATLASIDWVRRSGVYNIMVSQGSQGKGLGWFATCEMLRHAFQDLGLHRVEMAALASNIRSQNLCKKVGFVLEGRKRQVVFKNGKYEDMVIMAILESEWRERNECME